VLVDFIRPGFIHPINMPGAVNGRAGGTFISPTQMSEVLLITCLFAIQVVSVPYRLILTLLTGVGVALSFSRSSFIVGFLLFIMLCITRKIPKLALVVPITLLLFLPIVLVNFSDYLLSREDLSYDVDNLLTRLDFFQSYEVNDVSALERLEVMEAALNIFFQNPLLGAGIGATSLWSYWVGPHNQILMLAAEYGVMGLLLWVVLAIILWQGHYFKDQTFQHMACFIFMGISIFSHNILELPYWLLSIALISQPARQNKPY
jgi:O-Antigen ligase.